MEIVFNNINRKRVVFILPFIACSLLHEGVKLTWRFLMSKAASFCMNCLFVGIMISFFNYNTNNVCT